MDRGRLREPETRRKRDYTGLEAGAASGTTAPTPGRPYRAFHFSRVLPVPQWRIPRSFRRVIPGVSGE
jgi:hypothetical protein